MIRLTFPDGNYKEYQTPITGYEVAESISKSLAKSAMIISINSKLEDLSIPITSDAHIRIITDKDPEALEIIRHDAAHILAEAAKELYPDIQVTIGPAINNGFYYDFATQEPFSSNDLEKIEKKMYEIVARNNKFIKEIWDRNEAIEFFKSIGEAYKAEIISTIPQNEKITLYKQGDFIDLCRGPHAPSTGKIKYFKLLKLAGAYWRGDTKNEMLQRIYGTAWASKEDLGNHLHMLEEAEKRDHRKLGKALGLFHLDEYAPGMPFWHSKGWTIFRIIEDYIRKLLVKNGYIEVKTPALLDKTLWEKSGHCEKFIDNMYLTEVDNRMNAIKPMNCPCHIQIFKQHLKSYRDLPLRMAEFGSCYRNEPSGALHGLMRVRNFVQDDAHIFCTEDQINSETCKFCKLLMQIYKAFGFTDVEIKFSTRPDLRAGSDSLWDKAEKALEDAVKDAGYDFTIAPGEGAFYGPKLDFILKDAIGREWQCGTLQLDFVLPGRLGASYIDHQGNKTVPVMLHRAILGSFERFIAILIEQYSGKFPLWLAPVQVVVATITNFSDHYAKEIHNQLIHAGIRSELDISAEKINYKVRQNMLKKIPLIVIVGKSEIESSTVSVRKLGTDLTDQMRLEDLIVYINQTTEGCTI